MNESSAFLGVRCFLLFFPNIERGNTISGIATGEKQRYTLYRYFSISIALGVLNSRLNHIKFLIFNCSDLRKPKIVVFHWTYLILWINLTGNFWASFKVSGFPYTPNFLPELLRTAVWLHLPFALIQGRLPAGKQITEGKHGQKVWAGRKWKTEDTDNYQVDYVPLQKCHELIRSTVFFLRCVQWAWNSLKEQVLNLFSSKAMIKIYY